MSVRLAATLGRTLERGLQVARSKGALLGKTVAKAKNHKAIIAGAGFVGFIALSQGHAAPMEPPCLKTFRESTELSRGLVKKGKDFAVRIYYWPTDFSKGECGHISIGVATDGVANKHFGHWPADSIGGTPISILVPGKGDPVSSLEAEIRDREQKHPSSVLEVPIEKKQAEDLMREIDVQHSKKPCFSLTPYISAALHSITRMLPFGPPGERPIENCATTVSSMLRRAKIVDTDSSVPTTVYLAISRMAKSRQLSSQAVTDVPVHTPDIEELDDAIDAW